MIVQNVYDILQSMMPFETAEEWDNVGILAGSRAQTVSKILCALDFSASVLAEAVSLGAELIITHHPILFHGRKNLTEDDPEGALYANLVRARCALIAVHTNFDCATPGVNDALSKALGLSKIEPLESGMRIGTIFSETLGSFRRKVEVSLGDVARLYGCADMQISRVAVLGGAGGSYAEIARAAGADVYVTGEIGYHTALSCWDAGMAVIEAGHAATEGIAIHYLKDGLQKAADALQYNVEIFESAQKPFL